MDRMTQFIGPQRSDGDLLCRFPRRARPGRDEHLAQEATVRHYDKPQVPAGVRIRSATPEHDNECSKQNTEPPHPAWGPNVTGE